MHCVDVEGTTEMADGDVETQEKMIAGIYLDNQEQFNLSLYNMEHEWEGRTYLEVV